MSTKTLFDRDPDAGITEYFHQFPDGSFGIEQVQDVTDILDTNTRLQNADTLRYGEMHRVASVPLTVLLQQVKDGLLDTSFQPVDERRYRRWLNDPENSKFRTKRGRV